MVSPYKYEWKGSRFGPQVCGAPSPPNCAATPPAEMPPLSAGGEFTHPESCDRTGAARIAAKIKAYWLARGHAVRTREVDAGFHPSIRASRFDVRSDMVNGYPREWGAAQDQAERKRHEYA